MWNDKSQNWKMPRKGDVVQIKKDLILDTKDRNGVFVNKHMMEYRGRNVEVHYIDKIHRQSFMIKQDEEAWFWTPDTVIKQ